ncbi:MAG: hypothetical protein E7438_04980 [Ruminococcaceae bacterium]|nr:hypothetical protein [Oscillospiraceae bacterium]
MKRTAWKWIFGISLTVLILLVLFTVFVWALGNAFAAMAGAIMGEIDPDGFGYYYLSFGEFIEIGSPVFYAYAVDLAALTTGIIGLAASKKEKKADGTAKT